MSSSYTNQSLISGYISGANLIALTDDTNSGSINVGVLNSVIQAVSGTIDGLLAPIYDVPFNSANPPALVQEAATMMACAALYRRRLVPGEENMFAEEDKFYRDKLRAISEGTGGLDANTRRAFRPVIVSESRSRLYSRRDHCGWEHWDGGYVD